MEVVKKDIFLKKPSSQILEEVHTKYLDFTISEPILSYDKSPAKWALGVIIKEIEKIKFIVFITPGGWHKRHPADERTNFEGKCK